jgi:hypothetical protein
MVYAVPGTTAIVAVVAPPLPPGEGAKKTFAEAPPAAPCNVNVAEVAPAGGVHVPLPGVHVTVVVGNPDSVHVPVAAAWAGDAGTTTAANDATPIATALGSASQARVLGRRGESSGPLTCPPAESGASRLTRGEARLSAPGPAAHPVRVMPSVANSTGRSLHLRR